METITPAAPAERRSGPLTALLGLIVVGVGLWFAVAAYGGWYPIFKWAHVTLVVFWVGGGLLLTILGLMAETSDDPREIATVARQAAFVGERLFAPAGGLVLLAGVGMVINGHLGWNHFWVIAGLVGYASTMVTGIAFLTPLAKKVAASMEANGPEHPETIALIKRILVVARVDVAVLLLVVADMVTKPFA